MSDRREFLVAPGAGALAREAPLGAFGQQQGKVWRIGFLTVRQGPDLRAALARGMSDPGDVEGRNLLIEFRSAWEGPSAYPVGYGFVKSLARPGSNITGRSDLRTDTSLKLLEMLRSVTPALAGVAVLVNPTNTSQLL